MPWEVPGVGRRGLLSWLSPHLSPSQTRPISSLFQDMLWALVRLSVCRQVQKEGRRQKMGSSKMRHEGLWCPQLIPFGETPFGRVARWPVGLVRFSFVMCCLEFAFAFLMTVIWLVLHLECLFIFGWPLWEVCEAWKLWGINVFNELKKKCCVWWELGTQNCFALHDTKGHSSPENVG